MPPFPDELAILNKMVGANAITNEEREELLHEVLNLERAAAATPPSSPSIQLLVLGGVLLVFAGSVCVFVGANRERQRLPPPPSPPLPPNRPPEPPSPPSPPSAPPPLSPPPIDATCRILRGTVGGVILNTNGTRSRCPKCVDGLPSRLRRAYVLVGDSLDRNLVYNLCTSKSGAQYVPVCGAKNSFVCSLRDGKTAWLNFFLFGLLVPQHKTAPGAFFGDEPRLAHERITTLLPRMLANINDSQTAVTLQLSAGTWDQASANENPSELQYAFEDGSFFIEARRLIVATLAAAAASGVRPQHLLWHNTPVAPRSPVAPRTNLLHSSIGAAAACSLRATHHSNIRLLDWRSWSCLHHRAHVLPDELHYNANGSLLLANLLVEHERRSVDPCAAAHYVWDKAKTCCVPGTESIQDVESAPASKRAERDNLLKLKTRMKRQCVRRDHVRHVDQ